MGKKDKSRAEKELLDAIPERLIEWEKDGAVNRAVLLVPRFRSGFLAKWLQPRLKKPFMRVKLDEIGTLIWENCDGKKSIREICSILEGQFGERVNPVENRTRFFFNSLYKSKFVRYWKI